MINPATRAFVIARAGNRCEYCHLPQQGYVAALNVDHVISLPHLRDDDRGNLAFCCPKCNRKKGPNLAGIDPLTRSMVPLFHPRNDEWAQHFRWSGPLVLGLTARGRATIAVLDLNDQERVRLRRALIAEGTFGAG